MNGFVLGHFRGFERVMGHAPVRGFPGSKCKAIRGK